MLLVKTKLGLSNIEGIGLFADEDIKAGTIVWIWNPGIDDMFRFNEIAYKLSEVSLKQIKKYSYKLGNDYYILCGDDARFLNHSDNPNLSDANPNETIAKVDIKAGEELTCNYAEFDADFQSYNGYK